ncbi:MAG: arginine-tRNA-protein transferase [Saprospiraceae bacterium]|nr:arginine-tRNA-protein transferase [Saprospiraceae bacterium]
MESTLFLMITEIHYPEMLAPEKLDEYLARGWFRMGMMIFTCHFLCFENELYSAVWTRLPLEDYSFRKSLRKLLKKNSERFNVVTRPAQFDAEKEELYQKHKTRFEGYIAPSLTESLFGNTERANIYNTWETSIYDGGELVGASFFDLGSDSMASIMGLFNPDYEKYSLGFFTMLLEIQYGLGKNLQYYYPGYVVPGYERFDYKLRVGEVEYYQLRSKTWESMDSLDSKDLPAELLIAKLWNAELELNKEGIPFRKFVYQLYDKKLFGFDEMDYFRAPLFLKLASQEDNPNKWLVLEYDYLNKSFKVSQVAKFNDPLMFIYDLFKEVDPDKSMLDFLFLEKVLFSELDIRVLMQRLKEEVPKFIAGKN